MTLPPVPSEQLEDDVDPALAAAVLEIETHVGQDGWDRPARLYALVETARLVAREPDLAAATGLDDTAAAGSLTPVEQELLRADLPLERQLEEIGWPEGVVGCAAVVERFVLPPGADDELPEDAEAQAEYAREHPDRQEVRMVAGATRHGASYCALRLRAHDDPASVVGGVDLVPGLLALLHETLVDPDQTADQSTDQSVEPAASPPVAPPTDPGTGSGQGGAGTMEDPDPAIVDPRGRRPPEENRQ